MIELAPLTAALAVVGVNWIAPGVVGNLSDRLLCKGTHHLLAKLRESEKTPRNHDVARAVRLAHFKALRMVVLDYRDQGRPEWVAEPHKRPDMFFETIQPIYEKGIALCREGKELPPLAFGEALVKSIALVLSPPPHDGAATERAEELAQITEDLVVDAVRKELGKIRIPDGFEDHLRSGGNATPRYMVHFGLFIAEELKNNQRFHAIYVPMQISEIQSVLSQLDAKMDQALINQGEILRIVRQEKGVPHSALQGVLSKYIDREVPAEEILPSLYRWADEYHKLQARLAQLDSASPDVSAVRRIAGEQLKMGDLDGARSLLRELREKIRNERRDRAVDEAKLLEDEAEIEKLKLEYRDAARLLQEAAELVGFDQRKQFGFLIKAGDALYLHGKEFGDNQVLVQTIDLLKRAMALCSRQDGPLDWAMTQHNLGIALCTLGNRESGTKRLEEAVVAYRAALEERRRERVPLDWAATQNNLGGALSILGNRESGTERLMEAVAAHRAALEECQRERVPLDWAMTQHNLGNALYTLGNRESGTERLIEAVVAYRAALEEYKKERVPLIWAATQHNLGTALNALGDRENGTEKLMEAVAAYRAALEERRRERVPLDWAATQNNLGTALHTLGKRESGTGRLLEAVAAHRAALEESQRERVPLAWAATQNNLGNVLLTLGNRESETGRLLEAVAAYRAALEVFRADGLSHYQSVTQANLEQTLELIAGRQQGR